MVINYVLMYLILKKRLRKVIKKKKKFDIVYIKINRKWYIILSILLY